MELPDGCNYFANNDSALYVDLLRSIWQKEAQMPPEITLEATPLSAIPPMDEDLPRCSAVARIDSPSCKRAQMVKRKWSTDEDRMLLNLVEECGTGSWFHIAERLKTRLANQCRARWHNHLKPNIKKDTWTENEDRVLVDAHTEFGNKWAKIAQRLPGRAQNTIKNRWNSAKRRVLAGRALKGQQGNSFLEDYIISIHPPPPAQDVSPADTAIPPIGPDNAMFDTVDLQEFLFQLDDGDGLSTQEIATPSKLSLSQSEALVKIEEEFMEIIAHVA